MPFSSDQKRTIIDRVLIGIPIVALIGMCIGAAIVLNIFHKNSIETEYLKENTPAILRDRYQNGSSKQSQEMVWPDLIHKNHPNATHMSGLQVDQAFPYLKYVNLKVSDDNGWHYWQFQVNHYKLIPGSGPDPVQITDMEWIRELENSQVSLAK